MSLGRDRKLTRAELALLADTLEIYEAAQLGGTARAEELRKVCKQLGQDGGYLSWARRMVRAAK